MPAPIRTLRMILNTFYSGPQAWFFLAEDRGYLREAGIALAFTEGDTAANAVPRVASGEFEAGYGDMNALIELAATAPPDQPCQALGVFATFNASPYTIAVPATSEITTPRDLVGGLVGSHPNDAAMRMLPELGLAAGFDASAVRVELCADPHPQMIRAMLEESRWAGLFGFVNTLRAAAIEANIDPDRCLRFLEFRQFASDLYGSVLLVSRTLARDEPQLVRGLARAINRGIADTIADPDAAIAAVAKRNPALDRTANRARLVGTLGLEMSHPEGATLGIGEIDDARLARAIQLIVQAKQHPRTPSPQEIFSRAFLPPLEARIKSLARTSMA